MSKESKPLNPNHVYAEMHELCGTNIRNAKTRACVECDRLRHRKDFVPRPRVKKVAAKTAAVTSAPPFVIAKPEVSKEPLLPQTKKPEERLAVIEQIQSDLETFLANGGVIKKMSVVAHTNEKLKHGTRHAYVIAMCRCGPCTKWANKNRVAKGEVA